MAEESPRRGHMPWIGGVVLIALGVIFLLQSLDRLTLDNWWALFILIPAFGSFSTAWGIYQRNGRKLTRSTTGPITGGLVLTCVAAIFLFGLDIGKFWPVFLILAGVGTLAGLIVTGE